MKRRILTRICLIVGIGEQGIFLPEEMKYINDFISWTSTTGREYDANAKLWRDRNNYNDALDWLSMSDEFKLTIQG